MSGIRRATVADAAAMAAVERSAAHAPWSEASLADSLRVATTLAWVALDAEAVVVGHLLCSLAVDEGEVLELAVRKDRQRSGFARTLLRAAYAAWRDGGARRAFLDVRADNTPAIALYVSEGWSPCGRRQRYYRDGIDAILFEKTLS